MISWIQSTFQKHYRILFSVLLAIVIVSFVFTIGAMPSLTGEGRITEQPFFGRNLASREEATRIFDDARLSIYLQSGYPPYDQDQLQNYALTRTAGIGLADQYGIPEPAEEQLTAYIATLPAFQGAAGSFDSARYNQFIQMLESDPSLDQAVAKQVIADDYRLQRVQEALGGPGYVLPGELRNQVERLDTTWSVAVGLLDYAGFSPEIEVSEEQLQEYYEQNGFRYDRAPRVKVSYAEFPTEAYLPQVSFTEEELKRYYEENRYRFPVTDDKPAESAADASADAAAASPALSPEEQAAADFQKVRGEVEAALRQERARRAASKAAADFSYALFEQKVPPQSEALQALLGARNVQTRTLDAFSMEEPPADLGWSPQVASEAFRLNEKRFFSDPLATENGFVVLLWEENIPSVRPLLNEVRDKVAEDIRQDEKRRLFTERGQQILTSLRERLRSGATFTEAATAEGLNVKTFEEFSRRQPPAGMESSVLSRLERLGPGDVSEMVLEGTQGNFVYVMDKKAPVLDESNADFVATREGLVRSSANLSQALSLEELVRQELEASAPQPR